MKAPDVSLIKGHSGARAHLVFEMNTIYECFAHTFASDSDRKRAEVPSCVSLRSDPSAPGDQLHCLTEGCLVFVCCLFFGYSGPCRTENVSASPEKLQISFLVETSRKVQVIQVDQPEERLLNSFKNLLELHAARVAHNFVMPPGIPEDSRRTCVWTHNLYSNGMGTKRKLLNVTKDISLLTACNICRPSVPCLMPLSYLVDGELLNI